MQESIVQGQPFSAARSFCGRVVSVEDLKLIERLTHEYRGLTRTELASTVCELLSWHRPGGGPKTVECRQFLEALHEEGRIVLPAGLPRRPPGPQRALPTTAAGEWGETLQGALKEFQPVSIEPVVTAQERALWREWMQRYHYLGYRIAYGAQLQYFIWTHTPKRQRVGALQFSSPAWRMAARERWIGWSEAARRVNLQHVVSNSRFLIAPWVRIAHLASHALAQAARRLPEDWQTRYGVQPWLLETLVDPARFTGTCYRAANWVPVGLTTGRGRADREHRRHGQAPKTLFLYALSGEARQRLCTLADEA